ncbi:MAG: GNAT family N-acetyltransferase [Deltaproteobacteria bacterium]|nr:GNAT family N-acetyltransferase [Deltaproteobacteria bacterium]
MRIREVAHKDKEAIESIIRTNKNFTDEEKYCAVELLDFYLRDITKGEYLFIGAVEETDKPVGYLCYGKAPFADDVYDIYWIAIDPAWQGKRVGQMIIKHLEGVLKSNNARMIVAETSSQAAYGKTRLFYEKVGFSEASRIKDFYRVGDDKIIYIKQLKGEK